MSRVIYIVGGVLILAASAIDFAGVVTRIFALPSVEFGSSVAVWLTVWAAFLAGAPLAAEKGGHIAIMALPSIMGPKWAKIFERFAILCTMLAAGLLAYGGMLMTLSLHKRQVTYSLAMHAPQYLVKMCVLVGMVLMVYYCLIALLRGMSSPADDSSTGH